MRESRDDRHAEGAANAVVVNRFVPFEASTQGERGTAKQTTANRQE